MIELFRKNAASIGSWKIWNESNVIHISHCTTLGGAEVLHTETVHSGKQGRSILEQVKSRIDSRVSTMRDKGYKNSVSEAAAGSGNQLGLERPMLAVSLGKVKTANYANAVIQKKLNGHRCLITKQDGKIVAYSRKGKLITTIDHLTKGFESRLPEGVTIDGELYSHGVKLQTIASWIKRAQLDTLKLNFVAYDIMTNDSYIDRHDELSDLCADIPQNKVAGNVIVLPYIPYESNDHLMMERDRVISAGFEGLMVRLDKYGYQAGLRSQSLIKVKRAEDSEFKVVRIDPSEDGWAICICEVSPGGLTFGVSAPGNMSEKAKVYQDKDSYIGRFLTIEYFELTADGIPFHAVAIEWREDV